MRVVICGAGQVGYGIAQRLAAEHNDVAVIDTSPKLVQAIRDTLDVRAFVGHGAHPDVLAQAGIEGADLLIAVTLHDEVNMVACQVAHSLFEVPTKIARIRAQSYLQAHWSDLFSNDHLPIDVIISPEVEVGETVLRRLALPGAVDSISFADGEVSFIGVECGENCPIVDTPLTQLTELFPDLKAVVVGVLRNGAVSVPRSRDALQTGDVAYVVAVTSQVARTLGIFGHEEQEAGRVLLAGGGNIGLYVARALEERGAKTRVKIVEASRERAVQIADQLSRTVVIHGSGLDQDILREADVADTDTLVALTNDDQVNVLASVMGKRLGARKAMALINDPGFSDLSRTLGIDATVDPRVVTVSKVLRHVRRGRIRAVHSVHHGEAEVIEAEALATSPLVGQPLRDLELPVGVRIGAVFRNGAVVMPTGDLQIAAHDRVIMFALADRVQKVEQMFRVSLEFF